MTFTLNYKLIYAFNFFYLIFIILYFKLLTFLLKNHFIYVSFFI